MERVEATPEALKTMLEHGKSQLEKGLEVGGVITGRKENGGVMITGAIPLSVGQRTTVEITPELFAEAYKEREKRKIEDPIIGWYHSHPGYSCFMSDADKKAHKQMLNLYKDSIAFVIDPVMFVEGKPSSEFFKVFTISDGKVTEIPSDIDGSRKSKEEMFRGFVSGKETIIERIIMKPSQRSWIQIVGVGLLVLILLVNMYSISKVEEVENSLLAGGNFYSKLEKTENKLIELETGILTDIKESIYQGEENQIESIEEELQKIKEMVTSYAFDFEVESEPVFWGETLEITVTVKNSGNVHNQYTIEISGLDEFDFEKIEHLELERGERNTVSFKIDKFYPESLKTTIMVTVRDEYDEIEKPYYLNLKEGIEFTFEGKSLDPHLSEGTFSYEITSSESVCLEAEPTGDREFKIQWGEDIPEGVSITVGKIKIEKEHLITDRADICITCENDDSYTVTIEIIDTTSGAIYVLTFTIGE